MPPTQARALRGLVELLLDVGSRRVEQAIARLASIQLGGDQRLGNKIEQPILDHVRRRPVLAGDLLGGLQRKGSIERA